MYVCYYRQTHNGNDSDCDLIVLNVWREFIELFVDAPIQNLSPNYEEENQHVGNS